MPDYVYLNEALVPAEEAKVSVFDHGFLYGDGIFETIRAFGKKVILLNEHLDRLYKSAEIMKINLTWTKAELEKAIYDTIVANKAEHTVLRLTITRGEGPPVPNPDVCKKPTLVITCRPAPELSGEVYTKGVQVVVLNTRRNLSSAIPVMVKSCNFLNNIIARQELKMTGAYEGLMLNSEGYITEGTVNNIFFVRNNKLFTPALDCGLLDGVMRSYIIKLAAELGVAIETGNYSVDDILEADEIFLTNSVSLVVPVCQINSRLTPQIPGEITSLFFENAVARLVR